MWEQLAERMTGFAIAAGNYLSGNNGRKEKVDRLWNLQFLILFKRISAVEF